MKLFAFAIQAPNLESDTTIRVSPLFLAELQSRVLMAESALRQKEEDNAILRRRLNQYEEMWEKAASFQANSERKGVIASGDVVAHSSGKTVLQLLRQKMRVISVMTTPPRSERLQRPHIA